MGCTMNTSLKAILTAASIAVVASTVMAQSPITRPYVKDSAANTVTALVTTTTRVTGWMHPQRICYDCVPRMEP
jgi:hypothetical protein